MKKIFTIGLALASIVLLASCTQDEKIEFQEKLPYTEKVEEKATILDNVIKRTSEITFEENHYKMILNSTEKTTVEESKSINQYFDNYSSLYTYDDSKIEKDKNGKVLGEGKKNFAIYSYVDETNLMYYQMSEDYVNNDKSLSEERISKSQLELPNFSSYNEIEFASCDLFKDGSGYVFTYTKVSNDYSKSNEDGDSTKKKQCIIHVDSEFKLTYATCITELYNSKDYITEKSYDGLKLRQTITEKTIYSYDKQNKPNDFMNHFIPTKDNFKSANIELKNGSNIIECSLDYVMYSCEFKIDKAETFIIKGNVGDRINLGINFKYVIDDINDDYTGNNEGSIKSFVLTYSPLEANEEGFSITLTKEEVKVNITYSLQFTKDTVIVVHAEASVID